MEICHDVLVRMAVKIEADPRVFLEELLQLFSPDQIVPLHIVLKKRVVVE